MEQLRETPYGSETVARSRAGVDCDLPAFMLGVYNNMMLGLAITGLVALGNFMLATTTGANGRSALTPWDRRPISAR